MSTEPTLAEVLRTAIDSRMLDLHTALPGRIVSYDEAKQVADVEIVVKRGELDSKGAIVAESMPVIPNVPVGWLGGGGYGLQFPMSKGDGVWLIFSEAAWDHYRLNGQVGAPGDMRRHDLSYPTALPCLRSDKSPLPNPSGGALVTTPSGGALSVSEDGGAPEPVSIASKCQSEHSAFRSDILTLKAAVAAALGTLDTATASSSAPTFNSSTSSVPHSPGSVASVNLKAE